MIDDRDIWAAANLLLKRYGEDAAVQAAQRADELFDEGHFEGCAIWKRISLPWASSRALSQPGESG